MATPRTRSAIPCCVAGAVPALCFLHCAGVALLAPLLPAAAAAAHHHPLLEWTLWAASLACTAMILAHRGALVRPVLAAAVGAAACAGTIGLSLGPELLVQLALAALLLLQLATLRPRRPAGAPVPR